MRFEHRIALSVAVDQAWQLLSDVEQLAAYIPGVEAIEPGASPGTFRATVQDRLGPFRVQFPLDVQIITAQPPRLVFEAQGQERLTRSHVMTRFELTLTPQGEDRSSLEVVVDAQLTGRLASLGYPVLVRVFDEKVRAFGRAVAARAPGKG